MRIKRLNLFIFFMGLAIVQGCTTENIRRPATSGPAPQGTASIADFHGNWTGKLMDGPRCVLCSAAEDQQVFDAGMSSTSPTLEFITPTQQVAISIEMSSTQITLPRIDLVYRGQIKVDSDNVKSETYDINGGNLTATKTSCSQVGYSIQKNYCPFRRGTIEGNVITIFDPDYLDGGWAEVQYILEPSGTLRYGYGRTEISYEGQVRDERLRVSRVDFERH